MGGDGFLKQIPGRLKKLPVVHHPEILAMMKPPVLGAVLHTTNPQLPDGRPGRLLTLEEARNDFAGSGPPREKWFRSAHFMVDRAGVIGQFRSLIQGAAHIGKPWMPRYLGIEHTAHHGENLTDDQKNASADLLSVLRGELNFPLSPLNRPGESGVGVHQQFPASTGCGDGPFFDKGGFGPEFNEILSRALKRSPIGTWEVQVGDWTWIYSFGAGPDFSSGPVNWRSFDRTKSGTGKWNIRDAATLVIVWPTAQEEWKMPLESNSESGSLVKQLDDFKRDITKQLEKQGKTRISAHRTD